MSADNRNESNLGGLRVVTTYVVSRLRTGEWGLAMESPVSSLVGSKPDVVTRSVRLEFASGTLETRVVVFLPSYRFAKVSVVFLAVKSLNLRRGSDISDIGRPVVVERTGVPWL